MDELRWSFGCVPGKESLFYFGQTRGQAAEGCGLLFNEEDNQLIYGYWEGGRILELYSENKPDDPFLTTATKLTFSPLQTIYKDIPISLFDLDQFRSNEGKSELIYLKHEYHFDGYNFQEFIFYYLHFLQGLVKNAAILNLCKEKAFAFHFYSLVYSYKKDYFSFALCAQEECVGYLANGISFIPSYKQKLEACLPLLSSLKHLHNQGIAHDGINLNTIVIVREKADYVFKFNDFSRCLIIGNERPENFFTESIYTVDREFRAPETYLNERYNPFLADVFSIALIMLSLMNGKNLGRASEIEIGQEIEKVENETFKRKLMAALKFEPGCRSKLDPLLECTRTTTEQL